MPYAGSVHTCWEESHYIQVLTASLATWTSRWTMCLYRKHPIMNKWLKVPVFIFNFFYEVWESARQCIHWCRYEKASVDITNSTETKSFSGTFYRKEKEIMSFINIQLSSSRAVVNVSEVETLGRGCASCGPGLVRLSIDKQQLWGISVWCSHCLVITIFCLLSFHSYKAQKLKKYYIKIHALRYIYLLALQS